MNEKYVDGSAGALMKIIVRGGCLPVKGGCLPVRGITNMAWKYEDTRCVCGDVESEEHVLFEFNLYMDLRRRWMFSMLMCMML